MAVVAAEDDLRVLKHAASFIEIVNPLLIEGVRHGTDVIEDFISRGEGDNGIALAAVDDPRAFKRAAASSRL